MKKLALLLIATLLLSTVSYAGSFDGPYVSIGAGIQQSSNSNFSGTVSNDTSDTHPAGQILAGYSFETVTPNFNLAVNAFFNLSNDKAGSSSAIAATTKNNIGISIEPGYYLNDKTLAYVKLGYTSIDSKFDDGNLKTKDTLHGYLFGAGAKYLISKRIYVGAEISRYDYGRNTSKLTLPTSYKTDQNVGLITFGYQF